MPAMEIYLKRVRGEVNRSTNLLECGGGGGRESNRGALRSPRRPWCPGWFWG